MCQYGLPGAIVSNNGIQFASIVFIKFCKELDVQTKFISLVHSQANRQAKTANKIILKELKKKLDDAKGLWAEVLHEILWSYHTRVHYQGNHIFHGLRGWHTVSHRDWNTIMTADSFQQRSKRYRSKICSGPNRWVTRNRPYLRVFYQTQSRNKVQLQGKAEGDAEGRPSAKRGSHTCTTREVTT